MKDPKGFYPKGREGSLTFSERPRGEAAPKGRRRSLLLLNGPGGVTPRVEEQVVRPLNSMLIKFYGGKGDQREHFILSP